MQPHTIYLRSPEALLLSPWLNHAMQSHAIYLCSPEALMLSPWLSHAMQPHAIYLCSREALMFCPWLNHAMQPHAIYNCSHSIYYRSRTGANPGRGLPLYSQGRASPIKAAGCSNLRRIGWGQSRSGAHDILFARPARFRELARPSGVTIILRYLSRSKSYSIFKIPEGLRTVFSCP